MLIATAKSQSKQWSAANRPPPTRVPRARAPAGGKRARRLRSAAALLPVAGPGRPRADGAARLPGAGDSRSAPSVGAEPVSSGRSSSRRRWIPRRSADTRPSSSRRRSSSPPVQPPRRLLRARSRCDRGVGGDRQTVPAPRPRAAPAQPGCRTRRPRNAWWRPRRSVSTQRQEPCFAPPRSRGLPCPKPDDAWFARHPPGGLHISDF